MGYSRRSVDPQAALEFVRQHGVVLQAARGAVPNLAEAIAGEPIRGSWWSHTRGKAIYTATVAIGENPDVLVCKLVDGKITYVHRRLWPALVKSAARFDPERLARLWDEHTASGAHRTRKQPFPEWVPRDVLAAASTLSEAQAQAQLAPYFASEFER
jgi:hypothetical protein